MEENKSFKKTIINLLLTAFGVIVSIAGVLLIPALVIIPILWIKYNNIHMDIKAWILIVFLIIGLLNYIGFRR